MINSFLDLSRAHNWPPGNPQLLLKRFQDDVKPVLLCKCGRPAVKVGLHLTSKVERNLCAKCFSEVPARHDAKVWRFTDVTKEKVNP